MFHRRLNLTGPDLAVEAAATALVAAGTERIRITGLTMWGVLVLAEEVYREAVVKRTNINLDMDLVGQAGQALGTRRTTDTVHAALRDVIGRARRVRLSKRDLEDLSPEALDAVRRAAHHDA
jgi:Arc/MetJ family transcription regulator